MADQYIPGRCNIGRAEVNRRWVLGWVGAALTIIAAIGLWMGHSDPLWRILLFAPAFFSALGFLQAATHFCVGYGLLGVFNVGADLARTDTVEQAAARAEDRRRATGIIFAATAIAGILAGIACLIPL